MNCCNQPMRRDTERERIGGETITWVTWRCRACGKTETGRELTTPQYSAEDLDAILGGGWPIV